MKTGYAGKSEKSSTGFISSTRNFSQRLNFQQQRDDGFENRFAKVLKTQGKPALHKSLELSRIAGWQGAQAKTGFHSSQKTRTQAQFSVILDACTDKVELQRSTKLSQTGGIPLLVTHQEYCTTQQNYEEKLNSVREDIDDVTIQVPESNAIESNRKKKRQIKHEDLLPSLKSMQQAELDSAITFGLKQQNTMPGMHLNISVESLPHHSIELNTPSRQKKHDKKKNYITDFQILMLRSNEEQKIRNPKMFYQNFRYLLHPHITGAGNVNANLNVQERHKEWLQAQLIQARKIPKEFIRSHIEKQQMAELQKEDIIYMEPIAEEIKKLEAREHYIRAVVSKKKVTGTMPGAREQATIVYADNQRIYIFGGLSQDRYNDLRVVEKAFMRKPNLIIADDEWVWEYLNIQGYIPQKRFGHSMLAYNKQLFVFGGGKFIQSLGGSFSQTFGFRQTYQDVNSYDLRKKQWDMGLKPTGSIPERRMHSSCARMGNLMVIYGGYCGEKKEVLEDCYAFDLITHNWMKLVLFPDDGLSITKLRKKIQFTEGVVPSPIGKRFGHSMIAAVAPSNFSPQSDCFHWSRSKMRKPSSKSLSMQKCGFYMFGGCVQENKPLNDVWFLQPIQKINKDYIHRYAFVDQELSSEVYASFTQESHISLLCSKLETSGKPPEARTGHNAQFIDQRYMAIFGGRNFKYFLENNAIGMDDFHVLDLQTATWCGVAMYGEIPSPRWGSAMCKISEGELLIFGGVNFKSYCPCDLYQIFVGEEADKIIRNSRDKALELLEESRGHIVES